jgi:hypothetical protein
MDNSEVYLKALWTAINRFRAEAGLTKSEIVHGNTTRAFTDGTLSISIRKLYSFSEKLGVDIPTIMEETDRVFKDMLENSFDKPFQPEKQQKFVVKVKDKYFLRFSSATDNPVNFETISYLRELKALGVGLFDDEETAWKVASIVDGEVEETFIETI